MNRVMIDAALALLPTQMDSREARVMLRAIGWQESRFTHRFQVVAGKPGEKGPARGFWQFERGGGCVGVLKHPASSYWMHHLCKLRCCAPSLTALWLQIETDDVLAAGAARLLLFTDPKRLPALGDETGAWALYERVWRPGRPHRDTWAQAYQQAHQALDA